MSALAAATTPRDDVGSPEAYASELYERYNRAIFGFCVKQLRGRDDADDAVQTTFIYALLSLRKGVVPQLELPWLLTIARNVCSTRRRSGMRRGTYETPQDLESIQDKLPTPERADVGTTSDLSAALRAIPDRQRQALLLREWRGFSYDEIGSELGLTQAATEALIFRARQNVAQRLGAALKALNGWPVLSFLRGLLQSASVKAVAVGAGAALTVVGVPAAEPELRSPSLTVPTAVHAAATRTPARSYRDVGALSPRSASDVGASRVEGNGPAAGARSHAAATPVGGTDTGAPASAPSGQATEPSVPAAAAPPPAVSPKLPSVDAPAQGLVDTVTDAANSVELPPVTIPPVTVPPVSVGPVSTPAISTPPVTVHVQVPAVPPVHLP